MRSPPATIQRQTFPCSEAECPEHVIYEPHPAGGGGPYSPKDRIRVYLTCPRNHSRDYVVWPYLRR